MQAKWMPELLPLVLLLVLALGGGETAATRRADWLGIGGDPAETGEASLFADLAGEHSGRPGRGGGTWDSRLAGRERPGGPGSFTGHHERHERDHDYPKHSHRSGRGARGHHGRFYGRRHGSYQFSARERHGHFPPKGKRNPYRHHGRSRFGKRGHQGYHGRSRFGKRGHKGYHGRSRFGKRSHHGHFGHSQHQWNRYGHFRFDSNRRGGRWQHRRAQFSVRGRHDYSRRGPHGRYRFVNFQFRKRDRNGHFRPFWFNKGRRVRTNQWRHERQAPTRVKKSRSE